MAENCPKCGGTFEEGFLRLDPVGSLYPAFVVPGTPTSDNPVKAFLQGLKEEKDDRVFAVGGLRCSRCGYLELYANHEP
jgi:hypothetical protein